VIGGLFLIAALTLAWYLQNQVRRPSRWLGRLFLRDMNRRHSALTDWGLGHVEIGRQQAILDVGCGGGRTLAKLAALAPGARIVGIDDAAGSVRESKSHTAGRRVPSTRRQSFPAPLSRAGRISRQQVHQPVRIVSTNSAGSDSSSISRASASWS
jgi:SAM-dependent methyltransferase